jgi:hypothetical protein
MKITERIFLKELKSENKINQDKGNPVTLKLTMLVLMNECDKEGRVSMSYKQLSEKLGVSYTTAIINIKILVEKKYISKEKMIVEGGTVANRYEILKLPGQP